MFFNSFQAIGNKVGILTANPESSREMWVKRLKAVNIKPDFLIMKPNDATFSDGEYKGTVCKDLEIDYLFDDFEYGDQQMIKDFFSTNQGKTEVFTTFSYDPDGNPADGY